MNFEIETKRLILTPFKKSDIDLFHGFNTDPFIKKYLWDNENIDLAVSKEILNKNEELFKEQNYGIWEVRLKENKEAIGYTGLWHFFDEGQPQLLYVLLKNYSRKGYAKEFSTAIINYAFNSLNFKYLIASTDEANLDSQILAEKIGMSFHEKRPEDGKVTLFYKINK